MSVEPPATRVESMAACLLAECAQITWTSALERLRCGNGKSRDMLMRMAARAIEHMPHLERLPPDAETHYYAG